MRERIGDEGVQLTPVTLFTEAEERRFHEGSTFQKLQLTKRARKRLLAELETVSPETSVTLIQRQADVFPTSTIERNAIRGRPLVYDVDDAIWLDARGANGSALAFLKASRRKAGWLATTADHVIAGNELLADYLAHYAKAITVIPSVVDTADSPTRIHADDEELTIGWIGSRSTAPYVERLRPALERFAERLRPRRVRLLMVGGEMNAPAGVEYESIPWSVDAERRALVRIDVGIAPQPDTAWARGKCAYKTIQYMAAGIPVVADDVGVTARVVGDAGVVVRGERDWVEALFELADRVQRRAELGERGRHRAQAHYSLERWAPVLAGVLRGVG
jgi:glycosyltransferase involved in cell wall biosynthesis